MLHQVLIGMIRRSARSIIMKNELAQAFYIRWPDQLDSKYAEQYSCALLKELESYITMLPLRTELSSIFMSGSSHDNCLQWLLDMVGILKTRLCISHTAEVTLEVLRGMITGRSRTGQLRENELLELAQAGINRLSFDTTVLGSFQEIYVLVQKARPYFKTISVDMYLEDYDENTDIMNDLICLPIQHISVYFDRDIPEKAARGAVWENSMRTYTKLVKILKKMGLRQYTTYNFALPGFESQHDAIYNERKPFRGFGVGAWSFDMVSRFQNSENVDDYCWRIAHHNTAVVYEEDIDARQMWIEKIMGGLGRVDGISYQEIGQALDERQKTALNEQITVLKRAGLVCIDDGYVKLTRKGRFLENEVITRLIVV